MARCRAQLNISTGGELVCDLTEDHILVYPLHYDKLNKVEWRIAIEEPASVPAPPIPPLRRAGHAKRASVQQPDVKLTDSGSDFAEDLSVLLRR